MIGFFLLWGGSEATRLETFTVIALLLRGERSWIFDQRKLLINLTLVQRSRGSLSLAHLSEMFFLGQVLRLMEEKVIDVTLLHMLMISCRILQLYGRKCCYVLLLIFVSVLFADNGRFVINGSLSDLIIVDERFNDRHCHVSLLVILMFLWVCLVL